MDIRKLFAGSCAESLDVASTQREQALAHGETLGRKAVARERRSEGRSTDRGAPPPGEQRPLRALHPAEEAGDPLTRAQRTRLRRDLRQRCKGFQVGVLARAPLPPLPPPPPGLLDAAGYALPYTDFPLDFAEAPTRPVGEVPSCICPRSKATGGPAMLTRLATWIWR